MIEGNATFEILQQPNAFVASNEQGIELLATNTETSCRGWVAIELIKNLEMEFWW